MFPKKLLKRMVPKASTIITNPKRTKKILNQGMSMIRGKKHFKDIQSDLMDLMYLMKDAVTGNYKGLSKKNLLFIAAGIVYLVNPMDLVPDMIISLGFFDDLMVLSYVIQQMAQELSQYKNWRKEQSHQEPSLEEEGYQIIEQEVQK